MQSVPDSDIFSLLDTTNLEQNFVKSVVNIIFWFIKLPYRICKILIRTPIKIVFEFVDTFIVISLDKMNLTKTSAKDIATKTAKSNLLRLRSLCIFAMILISCFSLSFGFSFTVYSGLYLFMIPSDIT